MSEVKKFRILNLLGELPAALAAYFEKDQFHLVDRGTLDSYESLDYILVASGIQAKDVEKDFATERNEIKLICVGTVKEVREFLLSNGRLIIEPGFAATELGKSILNKFFFDKHTIHLASSFDESFPETKEFVITNHLTTGTHFDRLAVDAFERGFNIVSLRSFLDHAIYYLSYLKQAGLAGIPFEFEYGSNDDFFAVNIHTTVKNFVAEYLLDSFGEVNPHDPLSFLLGVMNRSCDFLEITSIENPSKVVFTGIWAKEKSVYLGGTAFHNILTTSQIIAQVEKQLANFTPEQEQLALQNQKLNELADKELPGGLVELKTSLEVNSVLNETPNAVEQMVNFTVEQFEAKFPDSSLPNMSYADLEQLMNDHPDQDMIAKLTQQDKEHLLERIQKKEMLDAYEAEVARTKEELEASGDLQQQVQAAVADELTNNLLANVDLGVLESLMLDPVGADRPLDNSNMQATDPFAGAEFGANQMPGGPQMPNAAGAMPDLSGFDLGAMAPGGGMPHLDGGDPFAVGEFNPAMQNVAQPAATQSSLSPEEIAQGYVETTDPATEEKIKLPINPSTLLPISLDELNQLKLEGKIDELTGLPIAGALDALAIPQAAGDPFAANFAGINPAIPNTQLNPNAPGAQPLINSDELSALGGLPSAPMGGDMPHLDGGDPFAMGNFDPSKQVNLPPGVQTMVNPQTGQPVHVMFDPNTGMPIPVKIDPQTGQAVPIAAAASSSTEAGSAGGDPFANMGMPGAMPGGDMGHLAGGDPFATTGFDPSKQTQTAAVDPITGQPVSGGAVDPFANMGMPGAMPGGDMGHLAGGDPFATGEFDPSKQGQAAAPAQKLPPGVQTIVDPNTGKPLHIMMDPTTGMPIPVEFDPQTGQVKPIAPAGKSAAAPIPGVEKAQAEAPKVNPKTGQPIMTMVDPKTGNEIHMSIDPNTGQPVQINPVTGEPIQVAINQTFNQAAAAGAPGAQNITIQQVSAAIGPDGAPAAAPPNITWNIGEGKIDIHIDPATGQPVAIDPTTGQQVPIPAKVRAMPEFNEELMRLGEKTKEQQAITNVKGSKNGPEDTTVVPDYKIPQRNDATVVTDFSSNFETETFIPGDLPEGMDLNTLISGGLPDAAEPTLIFGGESPDGKDPVTIIRGGQQEADDFIHRISAMEEDTSSNFFMEIGSNIMDTDTNAKFIVSGNVEETAHNIEMMVAKNLGSNQNIKNLDPKVKAFVRQNAPGEIQKGLEKFAQSQGVAANQLTKDQMQMFAQKEMPQIMQTVMQDKSKVEDFKQKIAAAPVVKNSELAQDKRIVKAHEDQQKQSILNQQKSLVKDPNLQQPDNFLGVPNGPRDIVPQEFENQFKAKLQGKMADMQKKMAQMQAEMNKAKADTRAAQNALSKAANTPETREQQMQKVLHETMKESFNEAFEKNKSLPPAEREKKEAEIIQGISKTLKIPEDQVKTIVKDANAKAVDKEKQIVQEKMQAIQQEKTLVKDTNQLDLNASKQIVADKGAAAANTMAQTALMAKLKKIEEENKKLKESMNAMKLRGDAKKEVDEKVQKVKEAVKVDDKEVEKTVIKEENKIVVPEPKVKIADEEVQAIKEKIEKKKELSDDEKQKMAVLFDASASNIKEVQKEAERQIKKLQIEAEKKEELFKGELDKAAKAIKAKELVLEKAKDTMKTVVTKKEQEIGVLKGQVNNLSQKLKDDKSTVLEGEVKSLSKENESLAKMSEMYKSKLESMAKMLAETKKEDNTAQLAEENKNLKRMKEQLEQKMAQVDKQYKKMEEVYQESGSTEAGLKTDLNRYKSEAKKAEGLIKTLKDQQKMMIEKMKKAQKAQELMTKRELDKQREQQQKLVKQLQDAQAKLKEARANESNVNEKELEERVARQYKEQVEKAKKEVNMAKQQTAQLQAKIKELTTKLSGGGAGNDGKAAAGSPKEKKLEQDVKRLNSEISKARKAEADQKKEVMTAKKEATALKNQLEAMKRELAKAKKAAAAGGKKAA